MQRLSLLLLSVLVCGCMVGPDYQRPYIDAPKEYHYEDPNATGSLNVEWWRQFKDPVLVSLIEEALVNNKDIQIAAARIIQTTGELLQTRSQLFPQFGYEISALRQRLSETTAMGVPVGFPNPQSIYQVLATVSWQADLFGRIKRLTESANAELFATIEARQGVILTLVGTVANNYLQLLGLDEQLAISKRTQESYLEALKYFKLQFEHGQVSQILVASAETQYETATAAIPEIELQIVTLENNLSVLLGRNPGHIERGKTIKELILPEVPEGIPSCILEQRPDILQAEANIIAANAQIGAAIALYFPSLTITGAYGTASQDIRDLFSGPSTVWSMLETIAGPIFTWGGIYGQVVQAEGATLAAIIAYKLAVLNAFADVENALASRIFLTEESATLGRLVDAAQEYVRLSKLQYDGGYSPYFVVIQAQQQLFPAELRWVQIRVQLFSSLVNIYQAMGGGWVLLADEKTYGSCDDKGQGTIGTPGTIATKDTVTLGNFSKAN